MTTNDEYAKAEAQLRIANGGNEPHYAWVIQYVKDPFFRAEVDRLAEKKSIESEEKP